MVDYIKPVLWKKPEVVILSTGTNDLTKGAETIGQLQEVSDLVENDDSTTDFVICTVITRGDGAGMNKMLTIIRDGYFYHYIGLHGKGNIFLEDVKEFIDRD